MGRGDGKKSLQDVLRARREAPALLSPAEAAKREAARRREGVEAEATAALERWRDGRSPDAGGKLAPETYRALFALSPAAYEATGHWTRRTKAQLASAPACEVERCRSVTGTRARQLTHATIGEEEPGRDLITLCAGCHRRAEKLGRELGRVPQRGEIVRLDPRRPLYEPADIAALKAKYAREG
ncbi:MAG TPA: hypothetical protein VNP89_05015 [Gaiellaceae bacterium]|nr:hypothetical protein [Gaiellaceae bacterium]